MAEPQVGRSLAHLPTLEVGNADLALALALHRKGTSISVKC